MCGVGSTEYYSVLGDIPVSDELTQLCLPVHHTTGLALVNVCLYPILMQKIPFPC